MGDQPPFYPSTTRPSVAELTDDLSLLDITQHVHPDPEEKFSIGSGASADVYKAIYRVTDPGTKEPYNLNVVVKILQGTPDASSEEFKALQKKFNRELACWLSLKHPNVAELLGIANFLPGRLTGLVSKWVLRNDFLKFIGSHTELKREKAKEIVSGLKYLHENGVIHGDLKADNVIVSDQRVAQLTDFGIGRILDTRGFTTVNRTPRNIRFTAPELMPLDDDSIVYPTSASDIFSLGMLLLQLFHSPDNDKQRKLPYNHVPFRGQYDSTLVKRIHAGGRPQRERYNYMEDQHWEIISKCWDGQPEQRPKITKVYTSL